MYAIQVIKIQIHHSSRYVRHLDNTRNAEKLHASSGAQRAVSTIFTNQETYYRGNSPFTSRSNRRERLHHQARGMDPSSRRQYLEAHLADLDTTKKHRLSASSVHYTIQLYRRVDTSPKFPCRVRNRTLRATKLQYFTAQHLHNGHYHRSTNYDRV